MSAVATVAGEKTTGAAPSLVGRVCLVTEAAGGGVGRHFLDLAAGLAAHGIDVVAVYSPGRCDALFRQRRATVHDVTFLELSMRRAVGPHDISDLGRLVQVLGRHGPFDIIHGHSSKGGALARLAGRWLGVATFYTPHAFVTLDPGLSQLKRSVYAFLERYLARHSAGLIAVSPDEAEHARSLGIDPRSVSVIPNGIEPPSFPPREAVRRTLGIRSDECVIGFVGRLTPQKAPDVLLKAFSLVAQQANAVRLVLVGAGPLEPLLRKRALDLGLADRVHLAGDQVATDLMPAFDVFCLASRYEGMTYVLLEALAAGLPIVATRVGGVSLCVEDGVNGATVPPDDPVALAEVLLRVATDEATRRQYAAAAGASAQRFTAARMVDETLKTYNAALTRPANLKRSVGRFVSSRP